MKIELYIDDSKKTFDNLKDLRIYLLTFKTIPQVKNLWVDGKSISYFGICYFIAHGNLSC
jgi:hypothetical protein